MKQQPNARHAHASHRSMQPKTDLINLSQHASMAVRIIDEVVFEANSGHFPLISERSSNGLAP